MVGIPMTGLIRSEWALARFGQIIPCNWSQTDCLHWIDACSPLNFVVADARNIIATRCVEGGFEWLFFIDHDVVLPPSTLLRWNERMLKGDVPVFCGLYFTRSVPSEPLIYRGRGNSYFTKWKMGDEVWADGIPMGCTVIHSSILRLMYEESPTYTIQPGLTVRKIFQTPQFSSFDPETLKWNAATGTEDLAWCSRVIEEDVLRRAGWREIGKKRFPFLVDTSVFCRHIDPDGTMFPARGEEQAFSPKRNHRRKHGLRAAKE